MAKLRKANAYRRIKRPYTRISKFKSKSYIRGVPGSKIQTFDIGNLNADFPVKVRLVSKKDINVRHNALESARITATHLLSEKYGKKGFSLHVHAFPHHVMRENALATGAGADRMQTGMRSSFGKPVGKSCRVNKGKVLMSVEVPEKGTKVAKQALRKAKCKLPMSCRIEQAE